MDTSDSGEAAMMEIGELAAAGVGLLAKKAVEKVGGDIGGRLVAVYDRVKAKLSGPVPAAALVEFEAAPGDGDVQAALRVQLKKALAADPEFREGLTALVREIEALPGGQQIVQHAVTVGDHNVTTQITGSGNRVTTPG